MSYNVSLWDYRRTFFAADSLVGATKKYLKTKLWDLQKSTKNGTEQTND